MDKVFRDNYRAMLTLLAEAAKDLQGQTWWTEPNKKYSNDENLFPPYMALYDLHHFLCANNKEIEKQFTEE